MHADLLAHLTGVVLHTAKSDVEGQAMAVGDMDGDNEGADVTGFLVGFEDVGVVVGNDMDGLDDGDDVAFLGVGLGVVGEEVVVGADVFTVGAEVALTVGAELVGDLVRTMGD